LVDPIISISISEKLANLEKIDLKFARIKKLDENTFDGLTSLTEIDLGRNELAHLDNKVFKELTSLKVLNLRISWLIWTTSRLRDYQV